MSVLPAIFLSMLKLDCFAFDGSYATLSLIGAVVVALESTRYYCLIMSEEYIKTHFDDIKRHSNIMEKRLDDAESTPESVLRDNAELLRFAQKHKSNYVLIENEYKIDFDL